MGAEAGRSETCYEWLNTSTLTPATYMPQLGDRVVYIWEGHEKLLESRNDNRSKRPWEELARRRSRRGAEGEEGGAQMRPAEPCEVVGIEYVLQGKWGLDQLFLEF
jgi:hypothetical protein